MKCPKNLGKYPFEGGEDCRRDCALALANGRGDYACGLAIAICQYLEGQGMTVRMNWNRGDDNERSSGQ